MAKDLSAYRKSYEKDGLRMEDASSSPFTLFKRWFEEVEAEGGLQEANAMTVSTIGLDGFPKARIVLLKKFDDSGFVFYTNYKSEKGKALALHPEVCLSFFWPNLERQVIIKGKAEQTSEEDSESYFHSRPKGSQLGALASPQSEIIPSRAVLEKKLKSLEEEYQDKESVPKPKHWGGYRVKPETFEFWQGRPNRLHDRIYYYQDQHGWSKRRLAP
ncbi:pyridoxamine 5'-phosphate oxidase [Croceiramulus getboli]|nr:pyridoxamine 5'-phosphate oxidase [Flavobacteriaceae bacterium YJPT1-3]